MYHQQHHHQRSSGSAWNAGRSVGPKRALKPQQVWEIRFHLEHEKRVRDRAMFDIAIDSKLRGCDVVKLRIGEVAISGQVRQRSMVVQQKTGTPVSFEIGETARESLRAWLSIRGGRPEEFLFPSRIDHTGHISTRQYARLVGEWVTAIGPERTPFATSLSCRAVPDPLNERPLQVTGAPSSTGRDGRIAAFRQRLTSWGQTPQQRQWRPQTRGCEGSSAPELY